MECYLFYRRVPRRNSLNFKYSGKRYVIDEFYNLFSISQPSQTDRGFPHETLDFSSVLNFRHSTWATVNGFQECEFEGMLCA